MCPRPGGIWSSSWQMAPRYRRVEASCPVSRWTHHFPQHQADADIAPDGFLPSPVPSPLLTDSSWEQFPKVPIGVCFWENPSDASSSPSSHLPVNSPSHWSHVLICPLPPFCLFPAKHSVQHSSYETQLTSTFLSFSLQPTLVTDHLPP